METNEILQVQLKEIEAWEQDQKGLWFWEKLGRIPFKILDKLTPKFIQEKIAGLINELANYVQTGGTYLVSEQATLKYIQKQTLTSIETLEDVTNRLPINEMTEMTEKLRKSRTKFSTAQGATTGIGGIFTLAVDIPLILGTALKTLQEIAYIHGYDPKSKEERIFIVKCLQFASSDIVGKEAILNELANYNEKDPDAIMSQLKGWQEVFYTYRDSFGWKKLFQMIPIAGIIFGAIANKGMMEDISEVGMMLYRKRRVMDRMQQLQENEA